MQATGPGELDILAKIRTIPGVDVIEGEYTNDSYKPKVDPISKMFKPYLLVKFNGGFATNDNGIVSSLHDTGRASITVFVVSPDDGVSRDLRDQLRVKMLDRFEPTDGSALRPGGSYSFVDSDLGYNRYAQVTSFSYTYNLHTVF